jgi:hypothetical protein
LPRQLGRSGDGSPPTTPQPATKKAPAGRDMESGPAADENLGLRGSEKRAFWPPRARLVAPTPSMRFVSAHFGAQTGRCRGPCQLKTSQQQASQQLRHHFVAVQAFAFACPKVPGRVGPFLRSPFLSPRETRQNCRGSTDRRGTNVGFLDWGVNPLLNGGLAIKNHLSVDWRRPGLASVAQP